MKLLKKFSRPLNIAVYIALIIVLVYAYKIKTQQRRVLDSSINLLSGQIESLIITNQNTEHFYQQQIKSLLADTSKLDAKIKIIQDKFNKSTCFSKDSDLVRDVYEAGFLSEKVIAEIEKIK